MEFITQTLGWWENASKWDWEEIAWNEHHRIQANKILQIKGNNLPCPILLIGQINVAWELSLGFNNLKFTEDLTRMTVLKSWGKILIAVDLKETGRKRIGGNTY